MKLGLTICLLLFVFQTHAQDWSPFNRTDHFNYQTDTVAFITSNFFADSIQVVGNDSIFYLNRIVKPLIETWDTVMVLKNQPQYWQRKMIRSDNGVYRFMEPGNKVLYTWAQVNESWLFDSVQNVSATVNSITTQTIFGNTDSVKNIFLSNGDSIKLSKHYGLIQFPKDDSLIHYSKLIGIDGRNLGELMPTFVSLFNLQMPDTLCYEWHYCHDYSDITSPIGPYDYHRTRYVATQQNLVGDSIFYYSGTEMWNRTEVYIDNQLMPPSVGYQSNYYWIRSKIDYPLLSNYYCNSLFPLSNQNIFLNGYPLLAPCYSWVRIDKSYEGLVTVHADYSLFPLNDTCLQCNDTLMTAPLFSYVLTFAGGIGFVRENCSGFEFNCQNQYYGACGIYSFIDNVERVGNLNDFKVSPVPSSGYVHISISDNKQHKIILLNVLGQPIKELNVSNGDAIDISSYPSGVYYLIIENDRGMQRKIVVKI